MYRKIIRYFDNKECLGKGYVPLHGIDYFQACLLYCPLLPLQPTDIYT
jgi:hypothetical protein